MIPKDKDEEITHFKYGRGSGQLLHLLPDLKVFQNDQVRVSCHEEGKAVDIL